MSKKNKKTKSATIVDINKDKAKETVAKKVENKETTTEHVEVADAEPIVVDPSKTNKTIIEEILKTPMDDKFSSLDQEGRLRYAELIERVYIHPRGNQQDPYVKAIADTMTRIFHATMVSIALRETVHGKNEYAIALRQYAYPSIQSVAEDIGYKLPSPEELNKMTEAQMKKAGITMNKDTGELRLEFKEENMAKELKEKLNEEGIGKIPELNVEKVDTDKKLKAALEYLLNTPDEKGNAVKSILSAVNWMRGYRINRARKKKIDDDELNELQNRTFREWLDDVTNIASPTILYLSVGSQYVKNILADKNPIRAFLAFKSSINGGEKKKLSDKDIAEVLSSIVGWIVGYTSEKNQDYLSGKNGELTEEHRKNFEQSNLDCINVIKYMTDCDEECVKAMLNAPTSSTDVPNMAKADYYWIFSMYFGKQVKDKTKKPIEQFENCEFNVMQKAGVICNYFRSEANQFESYSDSNINPLIPKKSDKEKTETSESPKKETESKK